MRSLKCLRPSKDRLAAVSTNVNGQNQSKVQCLNADWLHNPNAVILNAFCLCDKVIISAIIVTTNPTLSDIG